FPRHPHPAPRARHSFPTRRSSDLGTIEPSGNKNSALPIIAAALLTEHPVTLENVPRIRDTETLVELIRSVGASAEWTARNTLARSEEHTSELQSRENLVCRLLLEK